MEKIDECVQCGAQSSRNMNPNNPIGPKGLCANCDIFGEDWRERFTPGGRSVTPVTEKVERRDLA